MQVLLDGQRDGPVWPGDGRHRDFDAAVITPRRGVVVIRHEFLSPVVLGSGPRTLAPFTAILARLTDRRSYVACISRDQLLKQSPQSVVSSYRASPAQRVFGRRHSRTQGEVETWRSTPPCIESVDAGSDAVFRGGFERDL